jgi:hypothetical protein
MSDTSATTRMRGKIVVKSPTDPASSGRLNLKGEAGQVRSPFHVHRNVPRVCRALMIIPVSFNKFICFLP